MARGEHSLPVDASTPQAVGGSMTDDATTIWRPTADMRLRTQ